MTNKEAIKVLDRITVKNIEQKYNTAYEIGEALNIAIKALEQKKGKWIPIPFVLDYESDAKCSLCKESFIDAIDYNYCPNCSAKMESEE